MKLTDFNAKHTAKKALKETYEVDFNVDNLDRFKTKQMLGKVSRLIKEAKQSPNFYKKKTTDAYMKLVFMEQALVTHYQSLDKPSRIVVENEEVDKSQVILAAQDMVDSVQKMIEDVSDMQVKEMPALVNSIQSEIGAKESSEFNSKVSEALSGLNTTLQETRTALQDALNIVTGQESLNSFDLDTDDVDLESDLSDDEDDLDLDFGDLDDDEDDLDLDFSKDDGNVGRPRR